MTILTIPSNFVGDFKVGDNLRYNCRVLCHLTAASAGGLLNKPVVVQIGSILEAALSQIIYRAQHFTREGVPNISQEDQASIRASKIDKFAVVIDVLRKHAVLDRLDDADDIYASLHRLRKLRNKVHIQEDSRIEGASRDEAALFDSKLTAWAIRLNVRVLVFLSENLARPVYIDGYVGALEVPAAA